MISIFGILNFPPKISKKWDNRKIPENQLISNSFWGLTALPWYCTLYSMINSKCLLIHMTLVWKLRLVKNLYYRSWIMWRCLSKVFCHQGCESFFFKRTLFTDHVHATLATAVSFKFFLGTTLTELQFNSARVARLAILSPDLAKLAKFGPPPAKFIFDF